MKLIRDEIFLSILIGDEEEEGKYDLIMNDERVTLSTQFAVICTTRSQFLNPDLTHPMSMNF